MQSDLAALIEAFEKRRLAITEVDKVRDLLSARQQVSADLKQLRAKKREIASRFGKAERKENLAGLKNTMQLVSAEVAEFEARLRDTERQLLDLLSGPESQGRVGKDLPARFRQDRPHLQRVGASSFEQLGARNRSEWDEFVAGMPHATLYHDSRWLDVVTEAMRQPSMSLLARGSSGNIVGVLPLYRLKSILFGDYAVSVPYCNYGGAVGLNAGVEEALMREAGRVAESLGLDHVEFRDLTERSAWPRRTHKVSMVLRLPESDGTLEDQLGAKLRAQIRRAQREEVELDHGQSSTHLRDFYAVFARNMRDLGTPVYSRQLFEQILNRFPEAATLLIVRLGNRPVGGAFLVRHRDVLEIPWASTIRRFNPLGINMLMYREALRIAIGYGCSHFDFGRSSPDSGTYRFKQQWGAEPIWHHWHYWLRRGQRVPQIDPDNPRYRVLTAVWRCLPVSLTRWIGPGIVRNLP